MRIRRSTAVAIAGLLATLLGLGGCTGTGDDPAGHASASPRSPGAKRKDPGGYGGLLMGERWKIQWITMGGRSTTAPPDAAAWLEFGYDGLIRGSDGCHPLLRSARITADALTVQPAPRAYSGEDCEPARQSFRDRFRELFTGRLTINKRYDALTMDLKNENGDYIAVKFNRPEGMFGTRYWLAHNEVGDEPGPDYAAGKEIWFRFQTDGTMDGKLGCNTFTSSAVLDGERVAIGKLTPTTRRTCSAQIMRDEQSLLRSFPDSFGWRAQRGSLVLTQDIVQTMELVSYYFAALPGK
ncbi:META domain-containing protein [Streptomyces sp. NPDC007264]|uniref:META domain-containing protein n=1 Tax=Streptomyces sp. NPDC007264 TaxID=3364777 RepID=UPI0036DE94D0